MLRLPFLVILLALFPVTGKAAYGLQDLEILSQEGSYDEFLKHAMDVRPSERLGPWKNMVSNMAEAFAQNTLSKTKIQENKFKQTEELFRWPSLKSDDVFKLRRQEIGLKYLKTCLQQEKPCWQHLKNFWEADPSDPETAIKLAEMTQHMVLPELNSWSFLEVALSSPLSEFYCKKDFVMGALWKKIGIDYIRLGSKGDLLKKIDQTVHPDCLPSLNKAAYQRLYAPSEITDREIAYQILKSQNKENPSMTDFFLTVYLLESPSQGELFNYSWNRLLELGKSAERRTSVLGQLKTLDPLPDAIFSSLDLAKKKVILNHFKRNFPEYLDHYANQCIQFYGGKNSFPEGNPTIHCQDLMNSELAIPFLGKDKLQEFQRVHKI